MFERRGQPVVSLPKFFLRLFYTLIVGLGFIAVALAIGMHGYHYFEGMNWVDSFTNAAMILSGMGPFGPLHTTDGKLFAGIYALFSGLTFILTVGLIFSPIIHRFFHKFHIETDEDDTRD